MRHRNSHGTVTLIELLVVMGIMALVAAVIVGDARDFMSSQNTTEVETLEWELVGEGFLEDFESLSVMWRIDLGGVLYVVEGKYVVCYESPVKSGEYYYLYRRILSPEAGGDVYELVQEMKEA